MKNVIELSELNFESEVLKSSGPVLVDFYAPWCGPCQMLAPLLEQLAAKFKDRVKITRLNVDDAPERAGFHDITGVPTLMLFNGGQPVDQIVGLASPRALNSWLESFAGERSPAHRPGKA